MSSQTVKILVFIVLLIHGIGHLQGVVSSAGVKFRNSTQSRSWLLRGLGNQWNRLICLVLYLTAAILGIFAALGFRGLFGPDSQWTALALSCAVFSTIGLILFPKAMAMFFTKAGAVAVNLIIFYSILLNGQWPAAIFEN